MKVQHGRTIPPQQIAISKKVYPPISIQFTYALLEINRFSKNISKCPNRVLSLRLGLACFHKIFNISPCYIFKVLLHTVTFPE